MTDVLRVAVVGPYPQAPGLIAGGMRAAIAYLVGALQDCPEIELHVVNCQGDVKADSDRVDGKAWIHARRPSRRRLLPNLLSAVARIQETLREIQPHVVNAHSCQFAAAPLHMGLPTVVTLHGSARREAQIYGGRLYDRARYSLLRLFDFYTLPRARDIIAISPFIQREYATATRARWHSIANPVDPAFFAIPSGREVGGRILFVGSITPLKNIHLLLDALAVLPAAHLHVAGRATDAAYAAQLQQRGARHDVAGRVTMLGQLDHEALLQSYAEAEVVVLPSQQEVAPLALIEAMAAGKAVVAARVGGIPDLVEDNRTGILVPTGDTTALAGALCGLLSDPQRRQALGAAAQMYARKHHDARRVAAAYADVFRDVARGA